MEMMNINSKVRLGFPLLNCNIGQIYKANLTFRVVEMSMIGTTIEILDIDTGDKETTHIHQVVPSPS